MVEVLPPQPTPSGSGRTQAVPRFVPVIPQNKDKPVCPLCPRKFIITSPKSICTTCKAQFHKSCVKRLKWGFPDPFKCNPCLTTQEQPAPLHSSTMARPSTRCATSSTREPSSPNSSPVLTLPPSNAEPLPPTSVARQTSPSSPVLASPQATRTTCMTPPSVTPPHVTPAPGTPPHASPPPPPAAAPTQETALPSNTPAPPSQAKLSLDIGEHFINTRLKDERFRRCPGQKFTPRDMNCGPHAILHQLCNNPVYEVEDLYAPDGHAMFRKMVAEHFALQVQTGQNFWYEGTSLSDWVANMSRPGVMVDHYWLSACAKMIGRCIVLLPSFVQSSTHIGRIIRVWGGKYTKENPETAGDNPPLFLGYMEDNLYSGGHFQCIEPDPRFEESPIIRYLIGWSHQPISDELSIPPVPIPTPHIPVRNMPSSLSSLISCNSVLQPDCSTVLPTQEPHRDQGDSLCLAGNGAGNGRLESISSFGHPLASTRLVLSVSNSPVDKILSIKKKKTKTKKIPMSAVFEPSSSSEFSLPFAPLVRTSRSKRKADTQLFNNNSKRTRDSFDNVFD